jgi:hypothetical protein
MAIAQIPLPEPTSGGLLIATAAMFYLARHRDRVD